MLRNLLTPFLVVTLLAVAACAQAPYVHQAGEFNRFSDSYGQPVTDISSVTICYSSRSATPAQVSALAREECAKFGKTVTFKEQSYRTCPLAAPVAAIYNCLDTKKAENGGQKTENNGSTIINYDGIPFAY